MKIAVLGKQRDGVHRHVPFSVQARVSVLGGYEAGYRLKPEKWVWTGQTRESLDETLDLAGTIACAAIVTAEGGVDNVASD